eukprot:UN4184
MSAGLQVVLDGVDGTVDGGDHVLERVELDLDLLPLGCELLHGVGQAGKRAVRRGVHMKVELAVVLGLVLGGLAKREQACRRRGGRGHRANRVLLHLLELLRELLPHLGQLRLGLVHDLPRGRLDAVLDDVDRLIDPRDEVLERVPLALGLLALPLLARM